MINSIAQVVQKLPSTSRSTKGLGSIDTQSDIPLSHTNSSLSLSSPTKSIDIVPYDNEELITLIMNRSKSDLNVSIEIPYNISVSPNSFDSYTHRTIQVKCTHPLLGLSL